MGGGLGELGEKGEGIKQYKLPVRKIVLGI